MLVDTYAKTRDYAGKANSIAKLNLDMLKRIYIDNTQVLAPNGTAAVRAYNSDKKTVLGNEEYPGNVVLINAYGIAESVDGKGIIGGWGYCKARVEFTGSWANEIRSKQNNGGYRVTVSGRNVVKDAVSPVDNRGVYMTNDTDATWRTDEQNEKENNVTYIEINDLIQLQYPMSNGRGITFVDAPTVFNDVKPLLEGIGVGSVSDTVDGLWRSSKTARNVRQPGEIYVLDLQVLLKRDVRMSLKEKYRLWRNVQTQTDVYLLPNGTRLSVRGNSVRTVQELLNLNIDGQDRLASVVTNLHRSALGFKRLGLGYRSVLDFTTGQLRIPEDESFWLYTSEISGAWLARQFSDGTFRLYTADREAMEQRGENDPLPEGKVIEGLTPVERPDGARWYWIGATPETALSPDEELRLLTLDPDTDEAALWRVSAAAAAGGMAGKPEDFAVAQKAFLFRDRESDYVEDAVRYNVVMLDADGQGTVEFVTDLLDGSELQRPAPLYVDLRPIMLAGVDVPCYSIRDMLFIWLEGEGRISLLGGQYTVTSDETTFDSPYTGIEGNGTEDLTIIIKKNQLIWPEWLGDTSAADIQGSYYELKDGEWVEAAPEAAPMPA